MKIKSFFYLVLLLVASIVVADIYITYEGGNSNVDDDFAFSRNDDGTYDYYQYNENHGIQQDDYMDTISHSEASSMANDLLDNGWESGWEEMEDLNPET